MKLETAIRAFERVSLAIHSRHVTGQVGFVLNSYYGDDQRHSITVSGDPTISNNVTVSASTYNSRTARWERVAGVTLRDAAANDVATLAMMVDHLASNDWGDQ